MSNSGFSFYRPFDIDVANRYRRSNLEPQFVDADEQYWGPAGLAMWRLIATVNDQLGFLTSLYTALPTVRFCIATTPKKSGKFLQKDSPCVMGPLKNGYTIVIPALLTDRLMDFFLCVCASPAIDDLGLVYEPLYGHPAYLGSITGAVRKPTNDKRIAIDSLSGVATSPDAFACARLLHDMAVRSLVFHEFAHILHGHLRFLGKGGAAVMSEDLTAVSNVDLIRALEFDADAYSCGMIFRTFQSWVGKSVTWPEFEFTTHEVSGEFTIKDWQHATILSIVSMYGVYRAIEDGRTVSRDLWKGAHPPAQLRAIFAAEQIRLELRRVGHEVDALSFSRDFIAPAITAVEEGKRQMRPSHRVPLEEIQSYPEAHEAYMRRISPAWNEIRTELEGLKLGGTIQPAHKIVK